MADNVCGPSTGLKSFVDHVDRNRSIQQDRLVGPSRGSNNGAFRSRAAPANGADGAFEAFQTGASLPAMNGGGTFSRSAAYAHGRLSPATGGHVANNAWINEFQDMNLGHRMALNNPDQSAILDIVRPSAPGSILNTAIDHIPIHPSTILPNEMPMYLGYQGQRQLTNARPFMASTPSGAIGQQMSDVQPTVPEVDAATEAILNAAFQQFDDDFQIEMDQWMSAHGPNATEQEDVQANMEAIAQEQDANQADDNGLPAIPQPDELAKTATELLRSVSDNRDEKFQNSQFLNLMRRLANQEVVLQGDNLVEKDSGATLGIVARDQGGSSSAGEIDSGPGKGKGVAGDNTPTSI